MRRLGSPGEGLGEVQAREAPPGYGGEGTPGYGGEAPPVTEEREPPVTEEAATLATGA